MDLKLWQPITDESRLLSGPMPNTLLSTSSVLYACHGNRPFYKEQDLCYLAVTAIQFNNKMFHDCIPREYVYLTFKIKHL